MKKILLIMFFICTIFSLSGCVNTQKEYSKNMIYMDTYINIKVYSNKKDVKKVLEKVDNIYSKYNKLCDAFNEYDNIKNIYYINNKLNVNKKLIIDKDLYNLIKYGVKAYDISSGSVNIAMGNVTFLWKKYILKGNGIPTDEELNEASRNIDIKDIVLEDNTIMKKSNIKIDLGGIAKGYVTELAGKYLESVGIDKYIINAGGNVKVGKHYNNDLYKIGIEKPIKESHDIYKVVKVENESVVTSGNYERYYEYKGNVYHHIIDPKTLYPASYVRSVTVITKDSGYADILAKILFLMPIEDGKKYINSIKGVEAIWYGNKDDIYYSDGFDKYE
jgi:thiamine biosynthesis lipoprotein